jgi:hypothetical protein
MVVRGISALLVLCTLLARDTTHEAHGIAMPRKLLGVWRFEAPRTAALVPLLCQRRILFPKFPQCHFSSVCSATPRRTAAYSRPLLHKGPSRNLAMASVSLSLFVLRRPDKRLKMALGSENHKELCTAAAPRGAPASPNYRDSTHTHNPQFLPLAF